MLSAICKLILEQKCYLQVYIRKTILKKLTYFMQQNRIIHIPVLGIPIVKHKLDKKYLLRYICHQGSIQDWLHIRKVLYTINYTTPIWTWDPCSTNRYFTKYIKVKKLKPLWDCDELQTSFYILYRQITRWWPAKLMDRGKDGLVGKLMDRYMDGWMDGWVGRHMDGRRGEWICW